MTGRRTVSVDAEVHGEAAKVGERRAAILAAVRANGAVSVSELAERFSVTQQTIRRDLHSLDGKGLIHKGFGGAFASPGVAKFDYLERQGTQADIKRRLMLGIEEFLTPGATLFVGLGTTFNALHEVIVRHPGLLVATPNLEVAYNCAMNTDATVYIYGGYVRSKDSAVLTVADASRDRFKFDVALLGASAIDDEGDILEFDPLEVDLVRSILPLARQRILVAHHEKFRRRAPHKVASLREVDVLVTDGDVSGHFPDLRVLNSTRVISV
ncbi:DeoR/GlpR family DNA-binding transcription regulator [Arvimicrobium flavum]|uniref:DeoR/GlpR family DNA-binding transcription regulator n=1 Tax=Arvimicrobium flavum TaxID=3393320 RepID=UPI00237B3399|nr:DeoR/GlpR family DNA-binding transcription regulator [Mesorhizobium shangrilense]